MNKGHKTDYIKIFFIGIPLFFLIWAALFMLTGLLTRDADTSLHLSIIFTIIVMLAYVALSVHYADKIGAAIINDSYILKKSGHLTCDECGAITTLERVFKVEQSSFGLKTRLYCPSCWSKRYASRLKGTLSFYGLVAILGLILVLINPKFSFGWFFLNLFLFGIFIVILMMPHELGHVIAGVLLRMRVFKISIGFGKTIYTRKLFGWEWEIKSVPLGGVAFVLSKSSHLYRLRRFLMTLSGPLVNVIIFAVLLILGPTVPTLPGFSGIDIHPVLALFFANALVLLINLFPFKAMTAYGKLPSDGLALLTIPFLSRSKIREQLAVYYCFESEECRKQKQSEAAMHWCEEGLMTIPDSALILNCMGVVLLDMKAYKRARDVFYKVLLYSDNKPEMKIVLQNNIACVAVLAGGKEQLEEADKMSAEAYNNASWVPFVKGTRGLVLIEMGKYDEGLTLLKEAMEANESPQSKAVNACYIAIGEKRKGNIDNSRSYYELARALDRDCDLLNRVEDELKSAHDA